MPISVTCPGCSAHLNAPDSAGGKKVKCPKPGCNTVIPVPASLPPDPAFELVEDPVPAPPPVRKPKLIQAVVEVDEDESPRKQARRNDDDDDDDRPRKKRRDDDDDDDNRPRKKKRKKGGMGAGVIVAIAVGGLVLLGGIGFGIYALVGGLKASVPSGWVEYKSEKDNFRAYFPEKPQSNSFPAGLGGKEGVESISMHMTDRKDSSKRMVGVIVITFKTGSSAADRDKMMEEMRKSFSEDRDNRTSDPKSVRWAGHKAQEVVFDDLKGTGNKKSGGVIRYFATDTHAYIGIIGSESGRMKSEEENGFFDNFELLK